MCHVIVILCSTHIVLCYRHIVLWYRYIVLCHCHIVFVGVVEIFEIFLSPKAQSDPSIETIL